MKKKYFLLTFITILSLQSFGQDYDPIIKEGSFWDVMFQGSGACTGASRFEIANDTLINNITYKRIKVFPIFDSNGNSICYDGSPFMYTKIIFIMQKNLSVKV